MAYPESETTIDSNVVVAEWTGPVDIPQFISY